MNNDNEACEDLNSEEEKLFESIFKKYYGAIKNYISKFIGYNHKDEEITQEVFIKLYKNLKSIHPEKVKGWLYTVAHNKTIDYIRNDKEYLYIEDQAMDFMKGTDLDEEVEKRHKRQLILFIFKKLSKNQAYAIYLKDVDGLRYEEISAKMRISYKAVKSLIFRGRQNFIKLYEELNKNDT